jgi:hypothetical protein
MPDLATTKAHLQAVLRYLAEVERLRRRPTFRIADHKRLAIYEAEVTGLPGLALDVVEEETEVWLRLQRLHPQPVPPPPPLLRPWIDLKDDPGARPVLHQEVTLRPQEFQDLPAVAHRKPPGPDGTITLRLDECGYVETALDGYLREAWDPWAAEELPRRRAIRLYDRLFALHQSIETEGAGAPTEVVWGVGMAVWRQDREAISYPLLTQRVELAVDDATLAMAVRPAQREPVVELDLYRYLEIPGVRIVEEFANRFFAGLEEALSPFHRETFEPIVQTAVANLHRGARYWPHERMDPGDRTVPPGGGDLVITDTWVLFARERTTNVLAQDVQRLQLAVEDADQFSGPARTIALGPPTEHPERRPVRVRGIECFGFEPAPGDSQEGELLDL